MMCCLFSFNLFFHATVGFSPNWPWVVVIAGVVQQQRVDRHRGLHELPEQHHPAQLHACRQPLTLRHRHHQPPHELHPTTARRRVTVSVGQLVLEDDSILFIYTQGWLDPVYLYSRVTRSCLFICKGDSILFIYAQGWLSPVYLCSKVTQSCLFILNGDSFLFIYTQGWPNPVCLYSRVTQSCLFIWSGMFCMPKFLAYENKNMANRTTGPGGWLKPVYSYDLACFVHLNFQNMKIRTFPTEHDHKYSRFVL